MKQRCHNPDDAAFERYGAKGTFVCEEWMYDFLAFYNHIGPRPTPDHSIDRIDSRDGYRSGNVRWATSKEQSTNRPSWVHVIEFRGERLTMTDWAIRVGIGRKTLYDRFENGWTIEDALTTPKLRHAADRKKAPSPR